MQNIPKTHMRRTDACRMAGCIEEGPPDGMVSTLSVGKELPGWFVRGRMVHIPKKRHQGVFLAEHCPSLACPKVKTGVHVCSGSGPAWFQSISVLKSHNIITYIYPWGHRTVFGRST